jgi:hypothetical protein
VAHEPAKYSVSTTDLIPRGDLHVGEKLGAIYKRERHETELLAMGGRPGSTAHRPSRCRPSGAS